MSGLVDLLQNTLGSVPALVAYLLVGLVVAAESAILVGAVLPSLSVLLTAGALAAAGVLDVVPLITTAVGAAVVGDALGQLTGRAAGSRLLDSRWGRRVPARAWDRATAMAARHGGRTLFFGRFVPVVRTVGPHVAGMTGMRLANTVPWSLAAAFVWAGTEVAVGYTLLASSATVTLPSWVFPVAVGVLVTGGLAALLVTQGVRCRAVAVRPAASRP